MTGAGKGRRPNESFTGRHSFLQQSWKIKILILRFLRAIFKASPSVHLFSGFWPAVLSPPSSHQVFSTASGLYAEAGRERGPLTKYERIFFRQQFFCGGGAVWKLSSSFMLNCLWSLHSFSLSLLCFPCPYDTQYFLDWRGINPAGRIFGGYIWDCFCFRRFYFFRSLQNFLSFMQYHLCLYLHLVFCWWKGVDS